MSDFLLKLGIDGTQLKNPLNETIDTMHKVQDTAKETGKGIAVAFLDAGSSIDKVEAKLRPLNKDLESLKMLGKAAGQELAAAFKTGNVELLEKKIMEFQKKLASTSAKIDVKMDPAALALLDKQLQNSQSAMEQLSSATHFAKTMLKNMDPNSPEFAELAQNVEITEAAIQEFGDEVNKTTNKSKSLKSELRELKQEMAAMELRGETGSKKFRDMSLRAGELTDQIGDTNAQIKTLASDTKNFDALISGAQGITGGFVAAQGAAALFAGENEDLEKMLLKVNGAMAILQGLQAVATTLNKDSAFSVIFLSKARQADTIATQGQTGATLLQTIAMNGASLAAKALKISLGAIGIGILISLIAYLVANWDKLKKSMDGLLPTGKSVSGVFNDIKVVASGVGSVIITKIIEPIRALVSLIEGDLDGAIQHAMKAIDTVDAYKRGAADMTRKIANDAALEAKKTRMDDWENAIKIAEAEGRDVYATKSKWYANKVALAKKEGSDVKAVMQEAAEFEAQQRGKVAKEAAEAAKKSAEDAIKRREEQARKAQEAEAKRLEAKKKQDDLLARYTEEIQKLSITKMQEGFEKEKRAIELDAEQRIEALKKDGAVRGDVLAKQQELEAAIIAETTQKIKDLEKRRAEEIAEVKREGAKMILEFGKESEQSALALAEIEHQNRLLDIEKKFKDESDLKRKILEAEAVFYDDLKKEIQLKSREKELSELEQTEITTLEIASHYAKKSEETEEQKQIAILEIQQRYAKMKLENLMKNGGTDLEINNAILAIQQIENELEAYSKKGKKFDIFKFLGIGGDLTSQQKDNILNAAKDIAENIGQMADFIVDQYQRQIDKKQEVIDQYNNDIEDLEGQLEKEKDLRDEGLANNVDNIQKELDAKKAQRDEEIRQQKELADKQAAIRKAQMMAETAFQLVGMITSSVSIFKSATEMFGPFGVPIAIASIATMLGGFAAAKIKAFQAINEGNKFRDGGEIMFGGSHEQGGSKFYSEDGSGVELEKGEYVTKKKSYNKYRKFVKAFNEDDFSALSLADFDAVGIFERMGISLQNDAINEAMQEVNSNKAVFNAFSMPANITMGFGKMDENLAYLANAERQRIERGEDGDFYYRKQGTKITRISKK